MAHTRVAVRGWGVALICLLAVSPATRGDQTDIEAVARRARNHWAYQKPKRPNVPVVRNVAWPKNPIDHFILARLERERLGPSREAKRTTLVRRVSLDLTGLPPTVEDIDTFLSDDSPNAYERLADRLLASPAYGEHMARYWLDAARYADTNGYHVDAARSIWKYREWVIDAYNRNLPFDQFTIEQLAGDLLPDATRDQVIATGFHRNTMFNEEGGIDNEEFRTRAVVDRVGTTGTVWLGTTLTCCECHSHKYDPFTQREFYQLYAFFNNVPERGGGTRTSRAPLVELATPEQRVRLEEIRGEMATLQAGIEARKPEFSAALAAWEREVTNSIAQQETVGGLPDDVVMLLTTPVDQRSAEQKKKLAAHFRSITPTFRRPDERMAELHEAEKEFLKSVPTTLVMREMDKPRMTQIHVRGDFLNKGEAVTPGVPAVLAKVVAFPQDQPANRLSFARWLTDPNHPLVGRVTMNRMWEQHFGRGIVATSEDFGTQCEPPDHPELLDWLATEFIRTGWDVKAMHKLMVMSATYRQSSHVNNELLDRDPQNRLLARGPRFRMDAEMVRDNALKIGGLLTDRMGGPSVYPFQPPGLWIDIGSTGYGMERWPTSEGADRYRRGLYTFWRRSVPYPTFATFDAPSRQFCTVQRARTNTPLQALVTLNDPAFVEAAGGLAERMLTQRSSDMGERIVYGFRLCTSREPAPVERDRLVRLAGQQLDNYTRDPESANALVTQIRTTEPHDPTELAAWAVVANVMLNLDETITKN